MNDLLRLFARSLAILPREEVSFNQSHLCARIATAELFEAEKLPGRPTKANQIAETTIEQILDDSRTNEARSPGHENSVIRRDDE